MLRHGRGCTSCLASFTVAETSHGRRRSGERMVSSLLQAMADGGPDGVLSGAAVTSCGHGDAEEVLLVPGHDLRPTHANGLPALGAVATPVNLHA